MPDGLDISPEDHLQFTLTANEPTPKTILTLTHPGQGSHTEPVAFKVKTTQPRRYLVRPNQGMIMPGQSESVQILLVEKDKVQLWQSFERLGQSALDSSKDKFLVQSTKVSPSENLNAGDYEKLSQFWTKVMANTSNHGVFNTKLPVKLTGQASPEDASEAPSSKKEKEASSSSKGDVPKAVKTSNAKDVNSMSQDQLKAELTNLRGKYDELVSFSVNLTAERDILNNTLEQTKRDLNKYMSKANEESQGGANDKTGAAGGGAGGGFKMQFLYVIALLFWFLGAWMSHHGHTKILSYLPGTSNLFPLPEETAATPEPVAVKPEPVAKVEEEKPEVNEL